MQQETRASKTQGRLKSCKWTVSFCAKGRHTNHFQIHTGRKKLVLITKRKMITRRSVFHLSGAKDLKMRRILKWLKYPIHLVSTTGSNSTHPLSYLLWTCTNSFFENILEFDQKNKTKKLFLYSCQHTAQCFGWQLTESKLPLWGSVFVPFSSPHLRPPLSILSSLNLSFFWFGSAIFLVVRWSKGYKIPGEWYESNYDSVCARALQRQTVETY